MLQGSWGFRFFVFAVGLRSLRLQGFGLRVLGFGSPRSLLLPGILLKVRIGRSPEQVGFLFWGSYQNPKPSTTQVEQDVTFSHF